MSENTKQRLSNTAKAKFIVAEKDWQNEAVEYWFRLIGTDLGTEVTFHGEEYAIGETDSMSCVLDPEGYPLEEDDITAIAVRKAAKVTDEMRAQAQ